MDISETTVVSDIKEYINLYEYQRSGSFIDLGSRSLWTLVQDHSDSIFENFFFLETAKPIEANFK